jgi:hypothetical protein
MSNNKAFQARKLSQSFLAPYPSRSDPSEQELLASDGDFKPRTQAKHTARLQPPQGYTVINWTYPDLTDSLEILDLDCILH